MATFVAELHWRPKDYWTLTLAEREAIVKAYNRKSKKHG